MKYLELSPKLNLKDYLITDLLVDYKNQNVCIHMKTPDGEDCILETKSFITLKITNEEGWEKEYKVRTSKLIENEFFHTFMLLIILNTGAQISMNLKRT